MLANIVGEGRARVEVSADLDLTHVTKTATTFDPNGQVVRSTQTESLADNSTDSSNPGQVGTSTQLPGANTTSSAHRRRPPSRARPTRKPPTTKSRTPARPR